MIQLVKNLCSNGGFNLTKFISNNAAVLILLPDGSRRAAVKDEELALGSLPENNLWIEVSSGIQRKIYLVSKQNLWIAFNIK